MINTRTFTRTAFAFITLLWACLALAEGTDADRLNRTFPRSTLKIATPDARLHSFDIWAAQDDQRRQLGLMYVKKMDDKAAMLFIYPQPSRIGMWMKNTYIPLDMLFVAADGKVVQVVEKTTPESLKTIESNTDVVGVIELNAGTAARLNIRAGALVMHPAFGT